MRAKANVSLLCLIVACCLLSVGMLIMPTASSEGAVPNLLNYQGVLKDSSGVPYDGSATMAFSIWDDSTGGNKLWEEIHLTLTVSHGLFHVLLGSSDPIPDSVFRQPSAWLEVLVNGITLSPRRRTVSVGYAYDASHADTADYARSAPSSPDGDWKFLVTDTADTTLVTGSAWGIARHGNILYGNADSTHVSLGVACTTGTSGQDYKYCTVGGGYHNTASGEYATLGGGVENQARGEDATVSGGKNNKATGEDATVSGGQDNTASNQYASVGGGWSNMAGDVSAVVAGGQGNVASRAAATVSGGAVNTASNQYASVGGGWSDTASGFAATVAGGYHNTAIGSMTAVGGGRFNSASGLYATVPGGYADSAAGDHSLAAGSSVRISSDADYTFAFGRDFTTSTPNAVVFHNSHEPIKLGIGTPSPDEELHVAGNVKIVDGNQGAGKVLTSDADGVGTWQSAAAGGGTVPIGSVIAWMKSFPNTPPLPSNFVECNGQTLSDPESPFDGQTIPDLNGSAGPQGFLRGSTSSGSTGGEDTTPNHTHIVSKPGAEASGSGATGYTGQANATASSDGGHTNLPSYYEVVWIMRIR